MYWADRGLNLIRRANLDGTTVQDLVNTGSDKPSGIALNLANGKIFWTLDTGNKIQSANLDGSSSTTVLSAGIARPQYIAIDSDNGKMFWTDGTLPNSTIKKANLDGTNVEDLLISVNHPRGLMFEPTNKPPTVSVNGPFMRVQNGSSASETIATLVDDVTPVGSLTISLTSVPTGIVITSLTNSAGTVTATVGATCDAALGNNAVTLSVTDGDGATTNQNFIVNVTDTPPTMNCPLNIAVNTDAGACTALVNYTATATDNCPGVSYACVPASGAAFIKGITTVNCTATDVNSNTSTCSFTVTVTDAESPVITCPSPITRNTDLNACTTIVTWNAPAATDNCPNVGVPVCIPASGSSFSKGTTPVTCSTTDESGNPGSCSFNVLVIDTQAPTITCPLNISKNTDPNTCSSVATWTTPSVSDNCTGIGAPTCNPPSGTAFTKGTTMVTCSVTDASNNTTTCSFTVTITDTQAPTITCPSNITRSTDPNVCTAVVSWSALTVSDNCPGVGVAACTPASGSTFLKGTTTVSCTVADASGNTASCSFSVIVNDTQAPNITCPANIVKNTDFNLCSTAATWTSPSVSDNCPGVGVPSCTPVSGSVFQKGVTTVSCSVSDASGNSRTCTFTVTVNDVQPPTIACPSNQSFEADATCSGKNVTYTAPTVTDNCPNVTYSCVPTSGSFFNIGTTTVLCTARDASNNTATCSFTINIENRPIIAPEASTVSFSFGCKIKTALTRQIQINNTGGRFGGGVMQWTAASTASEITIITPNGVEGNYLQLKVNPGSLANGTYTRTVTLTGKNSVTNSPACNSPMTMTIRIVIEPDVQVTQTKTVTSAWTQFTNGVGQVFAEVKSNIGTIQNFTITCKPCTYPNQGLARLRYVKRMLTMSSSANTHNLDMKLYWNSAELFSVVNPSLIEIQQQPVPGGAWFSRGGSANVFENSVTSTGLTSISGIFGMATPWSPKRMSIAVTMALYDAQTKNSVMQFTTPLIPNEEGFYIERTSNPSEKIWDPVGQVAYQTSANYGFSERLPEAGVYFYRIFAIGNDGLMYESDPFSITASASPIAFGLEQNYPNPFSINGSATTISYQIPELSRVVLKVFDVHQREVATLVNEEKIGGRHSVNFDASNLPSGVYFYRLQSGKYSQTRRMTIMK